jgi:hypothetical protein
MIYAVMMILGEDAEQPNKWYCIAYSDDPHMADKYLELKERIAEKDKNCDTTYTIRMFSDKVFEYLLSENERFNIASPIEGEYNGVYLTESDAEFYADYVLDALNRTKINIEEILPVLKLFDNKECRDMRKKLKKFLDMIKDENELYESIDWEKAMKHFG